MATGRRPAAAARDALEEIDRRQRVGVVIEQIGQTFRTLIVIGGVGWLGWVARLMVGDLAGKSTDASVFVDVLGQIEVSVTLAWVVAGTGILYGYRQNQLRKRTVAKLHKRIETLELLIDPNRTSSQLTDRGETNPRDE